MSNEFEPQAPLFDLDALDQDSVEAARMAREAEYQRVQLLPDYDEAIARHAPLIQELDTSNLPLELKTVWYLHDRAVTTASRLQTDPGTVPEGSVGLAARFFGTNDTSSEAITAALHRYNDYLNVLDWAVVNGVTVAQSRETMEEFKSLPKPRFVVNPNLKEAPLRSDDPFIAAFQYDDFEVYDSDQRDNDQQE